MQTDRWRAVSVLIALVGVLLACNEGSRPSISTKGDTHLSSDNNGTAVFRVVDADTGKPIRGAHIQLGRVGKPATIEAETDNNGKVSITFRGSGQPTYSYRFFASGYKSVGGYTRPVGSGSSVTIKVSLHKR